MEIESSILFPKIYLLDFETRYDLCMSFVRFQEFYESDSNEIKGQYFSLEKYIDYWSNKFGNGVFDYTQRWTAFNIHGRTLNKWLETFAASKDIREKEKEVLNSVCKLVDEENLTSTRILNDVYVIAAHKEDPERYKQIAIDHEMSHAFYSLYPEYKSKCLKLLGSVKDKPKKKAYKTLTNMGYTKEVINDEMQAYFSTEEFPFHYSLKKRKKFFKNFVIFKSKLKKETI